MLREKQFGLGERRTKRLQEAGDKYVSAVICKDLSKNIEMVINAFVRFAVAGNTCTALAYYNVH